MLHYMTGNAQPLKFQSCGIFSSTVRWRHPERTLDSFVLLIGREGTLYIEQNGHQIELKKGSCVLLLPGHTHVGYRESESGLRYYWCHFYSRDPLVSLLEEAEMRHQVHIMRSNHFQGGFSDVLLLPEYGVIDSGERVSILFHQLMDFSQGECYSDYIMDYTLSLLAMEITRQCIERMQTISQDTKPVDLRMAELLEWIRVHSEQRLTPKEVALHFNYNPNHLSALIKRVTGMPLVQYLRKSEISNAKSLLLHPALTIREVAGMSGFPDEKQFMKVFKKYEGVTPTQYRNAFTQIHMNNR